MVEKKLNLEAEAAFANSQKQHAYNDFIELKMISDMSQQNLQAGGYGNTVDEALLSRLRQQIKASRKRAADFLASQK